MCTFVGSRSAARWYASNASAVWLLQDSYFRRVSVQSCPATDTKKQTYQGSEVVPNLRDVRVETDRAGVCVKRIPVLIDLVIEDSDGAPECWVPAVAVHRLLIGFVRLRVLLL